MAKLLLIDAPNAVYRAFHAVRRLARADGLPTNAIFGFAQMLHRALHDEQPTHLLAAFDPIGPSFRNEIYPEYKAHRPPPPEDLERQWPWIFRLLDALKIPRVQLNTHEADDLIATYARLARERGWEVVILSTDKDLMQLVGDGIVLVDTMKGVRYDAEAVQRKWGVPPEKIGDLLALTGDSSDNIPGIPGIGPKTAAQLLARYGSLEAVLAHADEIPQPKRRENLQKHADDARLARRLVALDAHAPVPLPLQALERKVPDREALEALLNELNFRSLRAAFLGEDEAPKARIEASIERKVRIVQTEEDLDALLQALAAAPEAAIDTETTSLAPHDAELVGISFCVQAGKAWYLPLGHREGKQLARAQALARLAPWLEDPNKRKWGHNLKYDLQVLRRAGIALAGVHADSMLLAYVHRSGRTPRLDDVAKAYLGVDTIHYEDITGRGRKQIRFDEVPIEKAAPYAGEDAELSYRLCKKLRALLAEEGRLARHDEIELPLSLVLAEMEWVGVKVDAGILQALSARFGKRIAEIEQEAQKIAGCALNLHSPKQLGEFLFETLKLPGGKRTRSGQWATDQEVLERLKDAHPIVQLALEARKLSKLKSTYTDKLARLIHPRTGRVHTNYNQAITITGRLSSSDPNLQNIPIRSEEGKEIRKAFVAEEGMCLLAADYSQIELRLMAHFSGDETLISAFQHGQDIHAATAAEIYGVPLDQVSPEMRRQAKIVNFGILYGMGAHGLARELGISRTEAQRYIQRYFERHPKIKAFIEQTIEKARDCGYVETLFGHRIWLDRIHSKHPGQRAEAERTAINAPLQGSAADIIKRAMIALHARLAPIGARMILQVHDELVVEAPEERLEEVRAIVREEMEQAASLAVPLIVDLGQGKDWFSAHGP